MASCNTCRFWSLTKIGGDMGTCRRNAPVAIPVAAGSQMTTVWPGTHVSDWCGAYVAIEAPAKPIDAGYVAPPIHEKI